MYTLEYFAPNGELRKVQMNERIPEERIGFIVEKVVQFVFPAPGQYVPYWEEMALRYFLLLGYCEEGRLEDDMLTLYEVTLSQPEMWDSFCKRTDIAQVKRINDGYKRLLDYNLHRPEPDDLKEMMKAVLDKLENYIGSTKFNKAVEKLSKAIEDKIATFDMKKKPGVN
jgi:hypothetical protein